MRKTSCLLVFLASSLLIGCRSDMDDLAEGPGLYMRLEPLAELDQHGCVACHATPSWKPVPAVRLADFGAFRSPSAIEAALSGHQPDMLGKRNESERAADLRALTHALVAEGGPLAESELALDAGLVEFGRQLYHGIGCVACHEPFEAPETLARALWDFPESFEPSRAPEKVHEFAGLRARTSFQALAAYLRDPLARHPSGRMPSLALDEREARALAGYLVYEDAAREGIALSSGKGLVLEVFEGSFPGETVDYDTLTPVRIEVASSFFEGLAHREDDYGFRFRGAIDVPASGRYTFYTTSDDGSMLYIDGALVVDNRGQHGPTEAEGEVTLTAGGHALEVTFFEHMGGDELSVRWKGPGFAKQELTFERLSHYQVKVPVRPAGFTVDAAEALRGRELLARLDCLVCHGDAQSRAPELAKLDGKKGCLSGVPAKGRPTYALGNDARKRLADLVGRELAVPAAAERLEGEFARLACSSCHARGEHGGPGDERRSYFQVVGGLDLGDEGRLPPSLDQVGAKLKEPWLREVLVGDGRVRPYMKTRMPHFGASNVDSLVGLFAAVDAHALDVREPEFSVAAVEAGKQLVGTKGLGCIQCHTFGGHASLGIPAVDLAGVHARIQPGWFRALLMDPVALKMNTRMPAFWVDGRSPVKSVLEGDPVRQIDAIWSYLSLGASMPLPHGLVPIEGEYEVEVYDVPVAIGVFMKDVSPRTICVGLPERVHYAFDVESSRLAMAWRGRFLDARGTWHARAGELEVPAGEDVIHFPPGPTFARVLLDQPWPTATSSCKLRRSDGTPSFSYRCDELEMTEWILGELHPGGTKLRRFFECGEGWGSEYSARLAVGGSIELVERVQDDYLFRVTGERDVLVRVKGLHREPSIVTGVLGQELRVPYSGWIGAYVDPGGVIYNALRIKEVEYSW
jgi:cytochrome c551/c552